MKLTLKQIVPQTPEAASFVFVPDEFPSFLPGQHISLRLIHHKPDYRGTVRQFTVSSSPTEKGILTVTTKKGVSSFKQALFSLTPGAVVEARGPGGQFLFESGSTGHHLMIAGGIGVTPFRSMVKYWLDQKLTDPITLIYSNRSEAEVVFRQELDSWVASRSKLTVVYTLTQPPTEPGWAGYRGRINEELIKTSLPAWRKATCYICGPPVMVSAMAALLSGMGINQEKIRLERFVGYK